MRNPASRNLSVALMLLALAACSTDTPTAPENTPAPPPGSGTSTAWTITLSAAPRSLDASATQPATITIQVRRASDGTPPQDGTTVVVSASLGDFNSAASGTKTVTLSLSAGAAQVLYFAGALFGTDTIQAQLENSVGSANLLIREADILFIQSVTPNNGPESGGTRIRISGTGFKQPLRVTLGPGANGVSANAAIDAVGTDAQGGFIRAITGPAFSPDAYFLTEGCDSDGDGTLDGVRSVSTVVGVNVELFPDGTTDSLPLAFTYSPRDTSCRVLVPGPNPPDPIGPPIADFSFFVQGLAVQFFNDTVTEGTTTYTWDFGDLSGFNTDEDPAHTYAAADTYTVKLRAENEAGFSIVEKDVTVP